MNVFITEQQQEDGPYEGLRIVAASWADAEVLARKLGVIIVGMIMDDD